MIRTVGTMTTGQRVLFWIYATPVFLYCGAFFIAGAVNANGTLVVVSLVFPIVTLATWARVIVRLHRRLVPLTWDYILVTFFIGPFTVLISRAR